MHNDRSAFVRGLREATLVAALASLLPAIAAAQSDKWRGVIPTLTVRGSAELVVEPFNDKQVKAKLVVKASGGDRDLAWDIAIGRCNMDGAPVAPLAAFPKIHTRLDGSGESSTRIPKLESGKQYYLRVFNPQQQGTDASAYGCANISVSETP